MSLGKKNNKFLNYLRKKWWYVLIVTFFGIWSIILWYNILFGENEKETKPLEKKIYSNYAVLLSDN